MILSIQSDKNLEEIIKACQRNECLAQEKLYYMFSKKFFGICLRYANDYLEAEDMLQEAFVKLYRNMEKYDFSGSFSAWASRVVSNNCIDLLRKKPNLYTISEESAYYLQTDALSALDRFNEADLIALIQALPIGYRTVFNMYVIEGFSHKEIAEKLEINEGTSKSQLNRARKLLQKKLVELGDIELPKRMNG